MLDIIKEVSIFIGIFIGIATLLLTIVCILFYTVAPKWLIEQELEQPIKKFFNKIGSKMG